ncbi:MAG TPA: 2,3-bisphosphoglycerate-independent phosphoglycerate mutase [Leptospiraceae bacterium]|nr:2,3-bisphosphoglycerate-independent phosphoglycerate mutase [Leptospiraceae bacterium]HNN58697.1 2,3-bisphosphoglycerate-independent phosphoglycerate mutase [Leptospiraceae bacterium]
MKSGESKLEPLKRLEKSIPGPLVFVIMDGVALAKGQAQGYPGNALDLSNAPCIKGLLASAPVQTTLQAHGTAVGMPSDEDMGNSEVGHNAMGAGRIFSQGASLVNQAIANKSLFAGKVWKKLIGNAAEPGAALKGSAVHFIGLLSDGNVHSHIDQLISLLQECSAQKVKEVYVHPLLDGRDVAKASAGIYIDKLTEALSSLAPENGKWRIASGGGRQVITMDRYEANWSMVELGWKTHVKGEGRPFSSAQEAIATMRKELPDAIDQDLPPFVIFENGKPVGPIKSGDVVIYFNFRGDRAIEISRAFTEKDFKPFKRDPEVSVHYAGLMQYDGDLNLPEDYLVSPPAIDHTISQYLVDAGVKQYACSETQKFGHVTYFWNGNNSQKFSETLEVWEEIPSDRISFDFKPEMKAKEITDAALKALSTKEFGFLRVNYANGDMVGHTGNLPASIRAVEYVDEAIARLLEGAKAAGATVLITADHGNCDEMIMLDKKGNAVKDEKGAYVPKTSHTLNPVPFILTGTASENYEIAAGKPGLANLAATVLTLLGFQKPEMYLPSIVQLKSK